MRTVSLGKLAVSKLGLGCLSMHRFYGPPPEERVSISTIHRAHEIGIRLIDTSDFYGDGANEQLIGRAIKPRRKDWVVATKFGIIQRGDGGYDVCGRPDYVERACEASLRRLNTDTIDLYYLHRVDKRVPIEDTIGAMAKLIDQGKVRFIGLSEAAPLTIRRAHAVHPITALQTEYSLWTRDVEDNILNVCNELGIGFVAYGALGRGFLAGSVPSVDDLEADDKRRQMPRFQGANFKKNLELLNSFRRLAESLGHTPAQLAIAWLLSHNSAYNLNSSAIVPLIGTSNRTRLEESAAAATIGLSEDLLAEIDQLFQSSPVAGARYSATQFGAIDLETNMSSQISQRLS